MSVSSKLATMFAAITAEDLAELDAEIARLQAIRAMVAGAAGRGNEPAPSPTAADGAEMPAPAAPFAPRSQYMRPILPALAAGPLTAAQIGERIGKAEGYWWEAFKKCPWFERANRPEERPSLWRLTEAGRTALAASSAGTAGPAT